MNHPDAISYIKHSLSDLLAHRMRVSPSQDPTKVEFRYSVHETGLHGQIWWTDVPSVVASEFPWDMLNIELNSLTEINGFLDCVANDCHIPLSSIPAPVPLYQRATEAPMFEIHPQRFRTFHPLGKHISQAVSNGRLKAFTENAWREVADAMVAAERSSHASKQVKWLRPTITSNNRRSGTRAIELGLFFGAFCESGKHIFKFPPQLIDMFARTDVDGIPLDLIKLPYQSFYLAFGPQKDLAVDGWMPDGAYVSEIGGEGNRILQFALTFAPINQDDYPQWFNHPEPVFTLAVDHERLKIGVGEAVDLVLSDKISVLNKQVSNGGHTAAMLGGIDRTSDNAAQELKNLPQSITAWKGVLTLIVNSMAYLSAYPDDIQPQWSDKTPQNLFLQMQDGSHKQKRNAESKLAALGYTEIKMCGQRISTQSPSQNRLNENVDEKRATWVKGHWTHQAHGPRWTLRKLQWRMPVLRNAESPGDADPLGHIYEVS